MLLSNMLQTLSLQCYVIVEYADKRYPFNVMLLAITSNILQTVSLQCYVIVEYTIQTLSLQCYVIVEYTIKVIPTMLRYYPSKG